MIDAVYSIELTRETLLETAGLAETYSHVDILSAALFNICMIFLANISVNERCSIFQMIPVGPDTSVVLHRLMKGLAKVMEEMCPNCKHFPCLNKHYVGRDNFTPNAKVRVDFVDIYETVNLEDDVLTLRTLENPATVREIPFPSDADIVFIIDFMC